MCRGLAPSAGMERADGTIWDWSRPTEVPEIWRDLAAKHQLSHEEDDLSSLEDDLKNSVQVRQGRQLLCRAIWRRKRPTRRHVDRTTKLEGCEEGRAPQGRSKSKHPNWEKVFGNSDVPKALTRILQYHVRIPKHSDGSETWTGRGRTSKMVTRVLQTHHLTSAMLSYAQDASTS